jgi:hypothetical protein
MFGLGAIVAHTFEENKKILLMGGHRGIALGGSARQLKKAESEIEWLELWKYSPGVTSASRWSRCGHRVCG